MAVWPGSMWKRVTADSNSTDRRFRLLETVNSAARNNLDLPDESRHAQLRLITWAEDLSSRYKDLSQTSRHGEAVGLANR